VIERAEVFLLEETLVTTVVPESPAVTVTPVNAEPVVALPKPTNTLPPSPSADTSPVATVIAEAAVGTVTSVNVYGVIVPFATAGTIV
jgi:hypothetical protein